MTKTDHPRPVYKSVGSENRCDRCPESTLCAMDIGVEGDGPADYVDPNIFDRGMVTKHLSLAYSVSSHIL